MMSSRSTRNLILAIVLVLVAGLALVPVQRASAQDVCPSPCFREWTGACLMWKDNTLTNIDKVPCGQAPASQSAPIYQEPAQQPAHQTPAGDSCPWPCKNGVNGCGVDGFNGWEQCPFLQGAQASQPAQQPTYQGQTQSSYTTSKLVYSSKDPNLLVAVPAQLAAQYTGFMIGALVGNLPGALIGTTLAGGAVAGAFIQPKVSVETTTHYRAPASQPAYQAPAPPPAQAPDPNGMVPCVPCDQGWCLPPGAKSCAAQ